jgi:ElaB/YqjD/DUF883 family membrane-anchored ribosome-binding protein
MPNSSTRAADAAIADLHDDAAFVAEEVRSFAKAEAGDAAATLQSAFAQLEDQVAAVVAQARKRARQVSADLDQRLHEHPLTGVGVGIAIGLVLAMMLNGRTVIYVKERPQGRA